VDEHSASHQIVADDKSFSSGVLAPVGKYRHVFVAGGTFAYHDGNNPALHGTVTVLQTRFVLMQTAAQTVTFTRSVMLRGQVSKRDSNGEEVLVQAEPYGSNDFQTVARTTTSNGFWQTLVKPRRNTVYQAVWNNVPSDGKSVLVRPLLRLRPASAGRVAVSASADVSLRGHRVLLQRLSRRLHMWRTFASVRLRRFNYTSTAYIASAVVRLHVRHGTIVRAFMTGAQAGPAMSGPTWSRSLRA
jgi:hypothetical protein